MHEEILLKIYDELVEIKFLLKSNRYVPQNRKKERAKYKSHQRVKILRISGDERLEFDGITQAAEITGIGRSGISNALTGVNRSAGGFKWEYVDPPKKLRNVFKSTGTAINI